MSSPNAGASSAFEEELQEGGEQQGQRSTKSLSYDYDSAASPISRESTDDQKKSFAGKTFEDTARGEDYEFENPMADRFTGAAFEEELQEGGEVGPLISYDGECRLTGRSLGALDEHSEFRISVFKVVTSRCAPLRMPRACNC